MEVPGVGVAWSRSVLCKVILKERFIAGAASDAKIVNGWFIAGADSAAKVVNG